MNSSGAEDAYEENVRLKKAYRAIEGVLISKQETAYMRAHGIPRTGWGFDKARAELRHSHRENLGIEDIVRD